MDRVTRASVFFYRLQKKSKKWGGAYACECVYVWAPPRTGARLSGYEQLFPFKLFDLFAIYNNLSI